MTISYPLSFPSSARGPKRVSFQEQPQVGMTQSPFTGSQQTYQWLGERLRAQVEFAPMQRADAEEWIGWRLALYGMAGSFLLYDPANTTPRGTWAGASPLLVGAHAAGVTTLSIDAVGASKTVAAGDWFQLGSGSSSRLHKVVIGGTANGGGAISIEVFPRTRVAYADNAALTLATPKGLFMLEPGQPAWDIEEAAMYGFSFSCMEDLRDV